MKAVLSPSKALLVLLAGVLGACNLARQFVKRSQGRLVYGASFAHRSEHFGDFNSFDLSRVVQVL
jgi:hypothetical protein